jgi:hypothetical protein
MMSHRISLLAAVLAIVPASTVADEILPRDRVSLGAGLFVVDYSSEARKTNDEREGTLIDLEDDLGMSEDDELLRLGATYRLNDRHQVFLSYMNMDRDARKEIQIDIEWKGIVFPLETLFNDTATTEIYTGGYTFYFLSKPRLELGATLGVYFTDLAFELEDEDELIKVQDSGSEPFPMIGLKGAFALTEKWHIRGGAEYFDIDLDDIEGDFLDVVVGIEYRFFKNLSAGLFYDVVRIEVEDTEDRDRLKYDYDGALLSFRWYM